jgi:solute carrier family 6 (neurotransmitter transporter, taurine) member 6
LFFFSDILIIGLIDGVTSIVCGLTVFSVLGYISKAQSRDIRNVVVAGPGLVFMVLPEALRNMSFSPFWSVIFFTMIFLLGIDSQFSMVETVITTIEDEFPNFVKKYLKRREFVVLAVCIITFLLSLPSVCPVSEVLNYNQLISNHFLFVLKGRHLLFYNNRLFYSRYFFILYNIL